MWRTHSAWPSTEPSRSPESESEPHCSTSAVGWYISITFCITGTKMRAQVSSLMPSRSGTLAE